MRISPDKLYDGPHRAQLDGGCRRLKKAVLGGEMGGRHRLETGLMELQLWMFVLLALVRWGDGKPVNANFSSCRPHADWGNCCTLTKLMQNPPVAKTLAEYLQMNPLPQNKRLRRAAHLVDASYVEKYNRAYELIRALPRDDPRSHFQQANLHCMYGSPDVRSQLGHPDKDYMVHKSWFLMPFHRWYEFFHERILAKVLGDEDFTLPFWNWDNQADVQPLPNVFPPIYRQFPGLFDQNRDQGHTQTSDMLIDLQFENVRDGIPPEHPEKLRVSNNRLLWDILCNRSDIDWEALYSPAFRDGENKPIVSGALEAIPHASIHLWTGNKLNAQWEDMGRGYSAARDPIFHAHHANMDRLWNIWLKVHGRDHIQDPDYLNAQFLFYDENAELVKVSVAEALDFDRLMYEYEEVEITWLHYNDYQCRFYPREDVTSGLASQVKVASDSFW